MTRGGTPSETRCCGGLAVRWCPCCAPSTPWVVWGGEEFGVLLPGVGPEAACCVAERLRAAIAAMEVPCDDGRGEALRVTVSVGVASCPPYHSVTEVLRAADKALYRAKASGRDRVVCGPVALLEMSCPESPTIP